MGLSVLENTVIISLVITTLGVIVVKIITALYMSKCDFNCCFGLFKFKRSGENEQSVRHLHASTDFLKNQQPDISIL